MGSLYIARLASVRTQQSDILRKSREKQRMFGSAECGLEETIRWHTFGWLFLNELDTRARS